MQKKVQAIVLILVVILVMSVFSTLPVHSIGDDDTDIVLIQINEQDDLKKSRL